MINQLKEKANYIRKNVVEISLKNGAGHIAPSLSCIEILIALYYKRMNIPKNQTDPGWANRDRLVFSKSAWLLWTLCNIGGYKSFTFWRMAGFL